MSEVYLVDENTGTETKLETVPSYTVTPESAHEGSGLYSVLKDYLPEDNGEINPEVKAEEPPTPPVEPEKKETPTPEVKAEESTPPTPATELENKYKEIEQKYNDAQKKIEEYEKSNPEIKQFIEGLKSDFEGTYNKYRTKLGLPDFGLIQSQITGGGIKARLKQYIETNVKPQVEKEFNLKEGEFKFDFQEAESDPTSASYRFLELKRAKEQELIGESVKIQQREADTLANIKNQQQLDIQRVASDFFEGDVTKAQDVYKEMEAVASKVALGQAKLEEHPFGLYNVIRGFKFEELKKQAVDTAVNDLKQQFATLGMYLPNDKEFPTDATKIKGVPKQDGKPFEINKSGYSPMEQSIIDTLSS